MTGITEGDPLYLVIQSSYQLSLCRETSAAELAESQASSGQKRLLCTERVGQTDFSKSDLSH